MMTGPITVEDMKECWQQEAREETWEEAAKAMKAKGIDTVTIAEVTGLSIDDIRRCRVPETEHTDRFFNRSR